MSFRLSDGLVKRADVTYILPCIFRTRTDETGAPGRGTVNNKGIKANV